MSQAATHQEGEIALARLPSPPRGAWSMCESWIVEVTVVTHPLVDHKLTLLRSKSTPSLPSSRNAANVGS